jgi:hypothetical protein
MTQFIGDCHEDMVVHWQESSNVESGAVEEACGRGSGQDPSLDVFGLKG